MLGRTCIGLSAQFLDAGSCVGGHSDGLGPFLPSRPLVPASSRRVSTSEWQLVHFLASASTSLDEFDEYDSFERVYSLTSS